MQLQTHAEALIYFQKIVKDCAESREEISNLDGFIDDKIPMILKLTFNKETEDLKTILMNACSSIRRGISRSQDYFKSSIVRVLESALKAGSEKELEGAETFAPRDFTQPIMDAVGGLMVNLVAAMNLFSRRSFEAAFLVALKLKEIEESGEGQHIRFRPREGGGIRVHPIWGSLADRGYNLLLRIPDFDNVLGNLLISLKGMCEKLENRENEVHDAILDAIDEGKRDREKLSELVYNALDIDKDFKSVVVDYVVDHLVVLGEHLMKTEKQIKVESIEKYLRTVFGSNGFLEYEVYAALLEHGVPALPRLVVSGDGVPGGRRELDVVARVGDELWLVEVTASENALKVDNKARNLSELKDRLGAEGALIVCIEETRKEILKQLPVCEGVEFLSFGELYSELQKLLKATKRRPAPHQELSSLFRLSAS